MIIIPSYSSEMKRSSLNTNPWCASKSIQQLSFFNGSRETEIRNVKRMNLSKAQSNQNIVTLKRIFISQRK